MATKKLQMSKQEAGYHEAMAGAEARGEAVKDGINDQQAEDIILSATRKGEIVRGKELRHPARGTMIRLYRISSIFDDWARERGLTEEDFRYVELSPLIMTLLYWDPHYFDHLLDKPAAGEELVAILDGINDDPDWMDDIRKLTLHMVDCNRARAQAAPGSAGEAGEEAKKN